MTGQPDTIGDVLRAFARHAPDAPAIFAPGRTALNFRDFAHHLDTVRETLNAGGVGRGGRVALLVPQRPEMAVAFLAVSDCATAAPLNPKFTAEEIEAHFLRTAVTALIVSDGLDTPAPEIADRLGLAVFHLKPSPGAPAGLFELSGAPPAAAERPGPAQASDIALLLPTSGTTSRPKIVPLRNGQMVDMARRNARAYGLDSDDRCLNLMPLFYHHGLNAALVLPLMSGCGVILPQACDAAGFFDSLSEFDPTWYSAGPTHHQDVAAHAAAHAQLITKSHLRFIRSGAGRLSQKVIADLEGAFGVPLIELYGMTETHGTVTSNPMPPGRRKPGTVGVPTESEVRVIDDDGNFLAQGQTGEIVVRGPCVFDGYDDDAQANADAFFDGWFRTGDEGVFDEDGYLTLTGRVKEVINRGGEKINPSEVDRALLEHPEVTEAVTFPVPHPTLGEEVVAAVVRAPEAQATDQDLTRFLLERLAGFKVPRRILFEPAIPKSETGKIQRYKLAETFGLDRIPTAPPKIRNRRLRTISVRSDPTEARLTVLWQRVLGRRNIGPDDNFFLLGGDSLMAVELVLQIEKAFNRRLPVAILFEAGTISTLAKVLAEGTSQGCIAPIQPLGDKPPLFCVGGVEGEAIAFYSLAKRLGENQPFYGIQAVGWDGTVVPFMRTDDMAAHYVAEMRKIQPEGPYFLGGFSFGGRIAIYMARQLRAAGQDVALLALFDPLAVGRKQYASLTAWRRNRDANPPHGVLSETARYLRLRLREWRGLTYDRLLGWLLTPVLAFYRRSGRRPPPMLRRPDRSNRLMRVEHRVMPHYDGDAVYFRVEPEQWDPLDTAWRRDSWSDIITGGIDFIAVPGKHSEILQELFVGILAAKLEAALSAAQAASGSTPPDATAAGDP